jgi:hypothetical protein
METAFNFARTISADSLAVGFGPDSVESLQAMLESAIEPNSRSNREFITVGFWFLDIGAFPYSSSVSQVRACAARGSTRRRTEQDACSGS